ncbi:hypothetical protein [Caulobacter sp. RL271]|uniref:Uncharacterized protein n=1 Tax=Caulobacter segnis TaxID=88688 RepID=A0ABY4ZXI8_9CAUL|nr:hypothetical protein [Caulobacter segnis]USQ97271.1 hypothetical protein MZV50_06930 [Caulobacter segnis]
MTDTSDLPHPPDPMKALTIVTSALASTLSKTEHHLLEVFMVNLQVVANEVSEDGGEDDPTLKWVANVSAQLLRSYSTT